MILEYTIPMKRIKNISLFSRVMRLIKDYEGMKHCQKYFHKELIKYSKFCKNQSNLTIKEYVSDWNHNIMKDYDFNRIYRKRVSSDTCNQNDFQQFYKKYQIITNYESQSRFFQDVKEIYSQTDNDVERQTVWKNMIIFGAFIGIGFVATRKVFFGK